MSETLEHAQRAHDTGAKIIDLVKELGADYDALHKIDDLIRMYEAHAKRAGMSQVAHRAMSEYAFENTHPVRPR